MKVIVKLFVPRDSKVPEDKTEVVDSYLDELGKTVRAVHTQREYKRCPASEVDIIEHGGRPAIEVVLSGSHKTIDRGAISSVIQDAIHFLAQELGIKEDKFRQPIITAELGLNGVGQTGEDDANDDFVLGAVD